MLQLARPLVLMLLVLRTELRIHFLLQLVLRIERSVPVQAVLVEVSIRLVVVYDAAQDNLRKLELLPFQVLHGVQSILPRAAPSIHGALIEPCEVLPRGLKPIQQHSALTG